MASTFTRFAAKSVGTTPAVLTTVPSATTVTIIGINIANTTAAQIKVDVYITISAVNVYLIKGAVIPVGKAFILAGGDLKDVLIAGDILTVVSDTATSADVYVSALVQA
jgi:hypothetical protein